MRARAIERIGVSKIWRETYPVLDFDANGVVLTARVEGASPDTPGCEAKEFRLRRSRSDRSCRERHLRCRMPSAPRPGVSLAEPRSTPGCENDTFGVEECGIRTVVPPTQVRQTQSGRVIPASTWSAQPANLFPSPSVAEIFPSPRPLPNNGPRAVRVRPLAARIDPIGAGDRYSRSSFSEFGVCGPQGFAHRPSLPEKHGRYDGRIHIQNREILHLRRLRLLSHSPFVGHLSVSTESPQR